MLCNRLSYSDLELGQARGSSAKQKQQREGEYRLSRPSFLVSLSCFIGT